MSKPVAHECTCSQQLIELRREMEELRSATRMRLQDDHESNTDFESDKENQQKRKRKSKNPVAISDLVYIFIDDSNVTHEGSRELSIGKGFNFNVDYNRLVITVLNGRTLGKVYIVGSTPPPPPNRCDNCNGLGHHAKECPSPINNRGVNTPKAENQPRDELERAKGLGFIVKIFQRNAENKEKKVDVQLTCDIMNTIRDENPGKLVLVAGDSDYSIPLNEAKKMNWEVETWFWPGGMSSDFKNWPHSSLKNHYKSFVYITGSTKNKHTTLEISGDMIKSWKWRNEPIMECFCSFGYFCQLYWVNNTTAHLYFDNEAHLKSVKGWLSNKYPNMLIKEQENDNRRRSHGKNPPRPANSNHSSTPSQKTDSPFADQMINGGAFS